MLPLQSILFVIRRSLLLKFIRIIIVFIGDFYRGFIIVIFTVVFINCFRIVLFITNVSGGRSREYDRLVAVVMAPSRRTMWRDSLSCFLTIIHKLKEVNDGDVLTYKPEHTA